MHDIELGLASCLSPLCLPLGRDKPNMLSFNSRVALVGVGLIKLERVLPYNVSLAWSPKLYSFDCECGVCERFYSTRECT